MTNKKCCKNCIWFQHPKICEVEIKGDVYDFTNVILATTIEDEPSSNEKPYCWRFTLFKKDILYTKKLMTDKKCCKNCVHFRCIKDDGKYETKSCILNDFFIGNNNEEYFIFCDQFKSKHEDLLAKQQVKKLLLDNLPKVRPIKRDRRTEQDNYWMNNGREEYADELNAIINKLFGDE